MKKCKNKTKQKATFKRTKGWKERVMEMKRKGILGVSSKDKDQILNDKGAHSLIW
jgi:hypothetical protein